ncbi:prolyl aminopeptidase, partial [Amaricoccus sp.]
VVVLHGGPGGGCSPGMRRFFDPGHYRTILFDQRGCGRSTPHASVEHNTTWDLVADIERIRVRLGIERWIVFGGSWGACLALIYAQTHPDRVEALVLRGVFTMTPAELHWFYGGGAGAFWPEQWRAFSQMVPREERGDLIAAYHRRLFGEDPAEQLRFARAWAGWESALAVLDPGDGRGNPSSSYALAFARLENHYFINGGFLDGDGHILRAMHRIDAIPGHIVQGRYDMICPPHTAHALHRAWPGSDLRMVATAGHALSEPGISAELVAIMDRLRS